MKPKTMILMVVAIVCGLGASYMTSRLLAEREDQQPAAPPPPEVVKVKILVAKTNLDHGAAVKEPKEMFTEKLVTQEEAPKEALNDFKLLKGKYLKQGLRKGDHVTVEDLMDERASILARLPDGYQAYGIQVDPASSAAGFSAVPGSKVNILWTMRRSDDKTSFSKLLLEDVLVLAGDTNTRPLEEGKAMPATVVTVALKMADTLKVKLAQQYGPLTLTLRKFGDKTPTPDSVAFNGEELLASEPEKIKEKRFKSGEEGGPGVDTDPSGVEVIPNINNPKKDPEKVALRPAQKKFFHVVTIRQGDKTTRQVIEIDANGNPIQDDVLATPPEVPPAVGAPPEAPPAPPAANKKDETEPK